MRENTYSDGVFLHLSDTIGSATSQAGTERFTCEQLQPVRARMLEVAKQILTDDQQAVVLLYMDGKKGKEIADALSWSETKVSRVLHGSSKKSNSAHPGALRVLGDALKADSLFGIAVHELEASAPAPVEDNEPGPAPWDQFILDWYREILTPPRPHLFGPLALLMLMSRLASPKKRTLTVSDIYAIAPKPVISAALPLLQSLGFIRSDGVEIRIVRTPNEEVKK